MLLQRIGDLRVSLGGAAHDDEEDEPTPRLRAPARFGRAPDDAPEAAGRGSAVGEGQAGAMLRGAAVSGCGRGGV